ncbi:MAG: hypothetical protein GY850_13220 [bacterium]|nr:hypothetical protein [bacterium]
MKKKSRFLMFLFSLLVGFLLFGVNAQAWVAMPEGSQAMGSDAEVTVSTVGVSVDNWAVAPNFYYKFSPAGESPTEALIIFPGAVVPPEAYAPAARDIAAAGYLAFIVPMPDGVAIFNHARASQVISDNPYVSTWSIGGHSLGGVSACTFANGSSDIDGVVLWASYPGGNMSASSQRFISIYGMNDGISTPEEIADSIPNVPESTSWAPLEGANHSQFGWYYDDAHTDPFVQPTPDPGDNPATITRAKQQSLISAYTINFLDSLNPVEPTAHSTVTGTDGSTWEKVNVPGFGNANNCSTIEMASFQGRIYALTRNDIQGAEMWRTNRDGGWEQVLFPNGVTNGIYGNQRLNNVWGALHVFQGKLYIGFSSGYQGAVLYSSGCEIWRYDGVQWEAVIADRADDEESGTITSIANCDNAGSTTADIIDNNKTWITDEWAGGILTVETAEGYVRKFYIVGNTVNTLTVQQNEKAGTGATQAAETEQTVCASHSFGSMFPSYSYDTGTVAVGDIYQIGTGTDENGFGEPWNKTITDMEVHEGALYVSTGLNYDFGAQVWSTVNGDDWEVTLPTNSFGNFHSDANYPNGQKPVSTSIPNLISSTVSGSTVLYAGGTGASGSLGSCARMAKLTPSGWDLIVDQGVDGDDDGTNENGFDGGSDCEMADGNFMPWSLEEFDGSLYAATQSLSGGRILYSMTGSSANDSWLYTVGGPFNLLQEGFGDNPYAGIAMNLFAFDGQLYAGTVSTFIPEQALCAFGACVEAEDLTGSKVFVTSDGLDWNEVTADGFEDPYNVNFEGFVEFEGSLYVSGSKGASASPSSLGGMDIFRLATGGVVGYCGDGTVQPELGENCETDGDCEGNETCDSCSCTPTLVELASFAAASLNAAVRINWSTAAEIDNVGFNLYRAETPAGPFVKINPALIAAEGSATQGASYTYVDSGLQNRKTYYYKLEDIDANGAVTSHGPEVATPRFIYGLFKK